MSFSSNSARQTPNQLREVLANEQRANYATTELAKIGISAESLGCTNTAPHSEALQARSELRRVINRYRDSLDPDKPYPPAAMATLEYLSAKIDLVNNRLDLMAQPFGTDAGTAANAGAASWEGKNGARVRILGRGDSVAAQAGAEDPGFGFGSFIRAMALGTKDSRIKASLGEGAIGTGGAFVPDRLAGTVIDRLRAQAVTLRAGARTVLMDTETLAIARVAGDPTVAWRLENAQIAESDPTFDRVTFTARSLAVIVTVSREVLEDAANLNDVLVDIFSRTMALAVDQAALTGSGVAPIPCGITNAAGVPTQAAAAFTYGSLLKARIAMANANAAEPTGVVLNPGDYGTLQGLTDTLGQPLRPPPALEALPYLPTTGIAAGTAIMGDFTQLLIGMRSQLQIDLLRELYAANHQYGFVAHLRADVQLAHPQSFVTIPITEPAG